VTYANACWIRSRDTRRKTDQTRATGKKFPSLSLQRSRRDGGELIRTVLERVGAQLIGAVLNDAHGSIQRYDEYYYSEDYSQVAE